MSTQKKQHFDTEQRAFITDALQTNATLAQITDDFLEIFSDFANTIDANERRDTIYRRIQKIKGKYLAEVEQSNGDSKNTEHQIDIPCLNPLWRVTYLRQLLRQIPNEDVDRKVKLLKAIQSEARLMRDDNDPRLSQEPPFDIDKMIQHSPTLGKVQVARKMGEADQSEDDTTDRNEIDDILRTAHN